MVKLIAVILMMMVMMFQPGKIFGSPIADEELEKRLNQMTLEQKVGQTMIGSFAGPVLSPELEFKIRWLHLGGVILYSVTGNIEQPEQIAKLTRDIQSTAREAGEVPLFIGIDQEGGRVTRITKGLTQFPGNMALGSTDNPLLAGQAAKVMARELSILGINMNYAPVLDVNSNPFNPIIGTRSFGSSPKQAALFGAAMIKSYNEEGIIATAKHFPGHGDTSKDSHLDLPVVNRTMAELQAVELVPFQEVAATVPAIMTAHIVLPAIDKYRPATLSPPALGLLRQKLKFEGLIITDSMNMAAISKHWSKGEAAVQAFLAGADILLYGADRDSTLKDHEIVHAALVKAVSEGRIPESRLDESVRRILRTKQRFAITGEVKPPQFTELASAAHQAVAEKIVSESITLVRDEQVLLPLRAAPSIPIIWPEENREALESLLQEVPHLKPYFIPLAVTAEHRKQVKKAVDQSPAVLIGTYHLSSQREWKNLIKTLEGKRTVILGVRSPYDLMFVPKTAAFIATYDDHPITMKMVGKMLKGEIAPRGRLPVTIPGMP